MTLAASNRRSRYEVTDPEGQDLFDIGFPMTVEDAVTVYLDGEEVAPEDYTVNVATLKVLLNSSAAAGAIISLEGTRPVLRTTDYPLRGALRTKRLNDDLDGITKMLQEMKRDMGRALQLNKADGDGVLATLPRAVPDAVIAWSANGQRLVNGPSIGEIAQAAANAQTAAEAAAAAEQSRLAAAASELAAENAAALCQEILASMEALAETTFDQFGAVGDGETDNNAAWAEAVAHGGRIRIRPGNYYATQQVVMDQSVYFIVDDPANTTFTFEVDNTECGFLILHSDCGILGGGKVIVDLTEPIGGHAGQRGTAVTIGEYFVGANPLDPIRRVWIGPLQAFRADGSELSNAYVAIGDVAEIYVDGTQASGGLGGWVIHWGGDAEYAGGPITQTWHPHDIYLNNIEVDECQYAIVISACYNVHVLGMNGQDNERALRVIPGDVGNTYSSAEEKDLVCTNITFRNVTLRNCTANDALDIDGEGRYPDADDYRRVSNKGVLFDNVTITTASGVTQAGIVQDCDGFVARGLVIRAAAGSSTVGLKIVRSREVVLEDYETNAYEALGVDRSSDVYVLRPKWRKPVNTTVTGTNVAIRISGNKYETTLGANVTLGATSITLGSAFPLRVYKGDIIRVAGTNNYAIVSADYESTGDTAIAVEAVDWTASSGATVYLDYTCDNIIVEGGVIDGYPTMVYARSNTAEHCGLVAFRGVMMRRCANRDFDMENIRTLMIQGCTTALNGLLYGANGTQTRSIAVQSIGAMFVTGNYIGAGSKHLYYGIIFANDNVANAVVKDNLFGAGIIGDAIGGTDVSAANIAAGRGAIFRNNRKDDGGRVVISLTGEDTLGTRRVTFGNAVPSAGSAQTGDIHLRATPVSGGPIGWMCSAGGSPGTWIPIPSVEEDSWVPTLVCATPGTPTYNAGTTVGTLRRIGDLIFCTGRLQLTGLGGASGVARIGGLKYLSAAGSYNRGGVDINTYANVSLSSGHLEARVNANAQTIELLRPSTTGKANVTAAELTNTTDIDFAFWYLAAAGL